MSQHNDHEESLPPGLAGRIDSVCDRFELEWKEGHRPRLEDFLPRVEAADRPALLRELLKLDLAYRVRHEEQPTAAEYRQRFPEHAHLIDGVFGAFKTNAPAVPSSPVEGGTVLQTTASLAAMVASLAAIGTGAASFQVPGYEILGELGEGGMGAVLKVRAPELGCDFAVKILLERHRGNADMVRGFLEEAQITSQLQHPGIPPVHEIGHLPDRRPFFIMKLVVGPTLADLLKKRESPACDLPRFLKIFEQFCQTLAYAHSRGVIHRDLKPLNVMVGAFGEVQVMDWGLAKVVKAGSVRTVRSERTDLETGAGTVMGTPAYMAREQACGDVEGLDARCDVFGLGAILCEILTGAPPYRGKDRLEVMSQAAAADLADALERLEGCGADAELVQLAKACLAKYPNDRPQDGSAVAAAMTGYLAGVQERLRQAELAKARAEVEKKAAVEKAAAEREQQQLILTLTQERLQKAEVERVAAQAKAVAERKRRRLTAAAYSLLLAVLVLGMIGGGATWLWQRAEKARGEAQAARDGLQDANRQLTQYSYANLVYMAQREWHAGQLEQTQELLKEAGNLQEKLTPGRRPWEWEYLNRAFLPEIAVLSGHTDDVRSVVFSPDGGRIATASKDKTVRLWDAASGQPLAVLEGHTDDVWSVVFSPDGRRIASASYDKTVRLWDAASGQPLAVLQGHTDAVRSVAFSPNDGRLATASDDGTARLWDAASGQPLAVLQGHTDAVRSVAFSPNDGRLATASDDGTARLWDAASGQPLAVLEGHTSAVTSVAFSPDGRRIATTSLDKTVRLWDAAAGKQLAVLQGDTRQVIPLAFSPEIHSRMNVLRFIGARASDVAFSPDGSHVATASGEKTAQLWDANSGEFLAILEGHTGPVWSVAFSPDGGRLATESDDGTARLWDAASGEPIAVLEGHTGPVLSVAFSPDGGRIATESDDGTARLWDAVSGQPHVVLEGHTEAVRSVAFSSDGRRIATASEDKTARLWDAVSGEPIAVLKGHTGPVLSVAFSPDSGRLATASWDGTARLWDATSGKQLVVLEGHTKAVLSVAFSPDGGRIATASWDGTARLWDAASGKQLAVLEGHTKSVLSVAFSPDGGRIATTSEDKTARLWDAASGKQLAVLEGHTGPVLSVAFSPDGGRIATTSEDTTARLWDAASGKPIAVLEGYTGPVYAVAFSSDGGRLATASRDGTARLWIAWESTADQEKRRRYWRERQAQDAEKEGYWFGAAFHLSRLINDEPTNASLYARRLKCYAHLGQWAKVGADLLQGAALCPAAADAAR